MDLFRQACVTIHQDDATSVHKSAERLNVGKFERFLKRRFQF